MPYSSTDAASSASMAQVAGSISLTRATSERRPQAGPLPAKVGELGYSPKLHGTPRQQEEEPVPDLPARHPADRPLASPHSTSSSESNHNTTSPANNNSSTSLPTSIHSSNSVSTTRTFLSFLKPARMSNPLPSFKGMRTASILRLIVLILTLTATIVGWVEIVLRLNGVAEAFGGSFDPSTGNSTFPNGTSTGNSTNPDNAFDSPDGGMASTTFIFVHVAFAVAVIFQLLFLERAIFQLRAERYIHLHPRAAAAYTAHARAMGFAPWHRPPLPTYAAALGVRGTGDVEDNIIAAPPPPAYGNTRGSTLLLAGFLRDSMRGRVPPDLGPDSPNARSSSARGSGISTNASARATGSEPEAVPDRPVSYGTSELVDVAGRAMHLEATLARLEDGRSST